jgi:hypothetical protein
LVEWAILAQSIAKIVGARPTRKPLGIRCIHNQTVYSRSWLHEGVKLCRHRIADLYAHPAQAVADLSVTYENGAPRLEFSADDARSYLIEASTNLADWAAIGVAVESVPQSGDFSFEDAQSLQFPVRYYRVVTQ